jgi:lactate permease
MTVLLALLPLLMIVVLMVGVGLSAARSALAGLVATLLVAVLVFGADAPVVMGAGVEAIFTAGTILWIIFPALCLHESQIATGAVDTLRMALTRLSGDKRLLAILIAWFFSLFIEGAAGFGTSAALAAPMLVSIGFSPLQAVTLALIGHVPGVSFGAVGTPILPQMAVTPFSGAQLAQASAVLHGALGWIIMVFLVRATTQGSSQPAPLGWAALAAGLFLGFYVLIGFSVGPELPTLGAALLGGAGFVWVLQRAKPIPTPSFTPNETARGSSRGVLWAGLPYLVLVGCILLTRLIPDVKAATQAVTVAWSLPGGFSGQFQPLYHPGTMLLLGFAVGGLAQGAPPAQMLGAMRRASLRLPGVALALVAMLSVARLMVHAGMIDALAIAASTHLGAVWPLLAPWVGILGSFVTGSATTSNILFTDFQQATAAALALPPLPLLGAQNFGAAVGNMICPHNIIAACAVVGLAGQEGAILRRTFLPCVIYALAGGALTWWLVVV